MRRCLRIELRSELCAKAVELYAALQSTLHSNSSSCMTIELSKLLTSCLTAIKNHLIKYCETVYEREDKNLFWSIKTSSEVLNKLKSKGLKASKLSI